MKHQTENELIQKAKNGDEQAITELYNRVKTTIYRTSLHYSRSTHIAEDATQHALSTAFLRINDYNYSATFQTWATTIARRYIIDHYRKQQVINKHILSLPAKTQTNQFEEIDTRERIDKAMKQLPKPHADLVNMVYLYEYTYEEAAQAFGVPIGTIKSRLSDYKKKLKEHLAT